MSPAFRAWTDDLLARARDGGWELAGEKPLPYGRQFTLQRGGARAVLSCYHGKKGFRCVPGGQAGDELAGALGLAGATPAARAAGPDPFTLGTPRIGCDESGKGDYFGPLVTAAFALGEGEAEALRSLGVADSKSLGDATIERIAGALERRGRHVLEVLMPREYNPRYEQVRNVNVLLSEMHGRCIRRLHDRLDPPAIAVIVDRFARDTVVLEREARLPAGCRLVTRPRGEADPAVAAASILARAAFVRGLRELEHEFGTRLPPGAGSPVLVAGRAFVRDFGRERLADVAKVHFATSHQL
jgi:ribonuclease HIII